MVEIPEILIEKLARSHRIVFLTGAGVSAEAGVATFRGDGGIWSKMSPEELASVDGFMKNPQLVWEWYQHRRVLMHDVKPNAGHYAIAELEKMYPETTLITQNIDSLHARAGSTNILELHGNISRNKCFKCGRFYEKEINPNGEIPHCDCGGVIRPDVVWFGEMLPKEVISKAFQAAERAELFFSVGTSAIVQPAASLPLIASHNNAFVVEINIEPTELTRRADLFLQGKSGETLPRIVERLREYI
jgi:NAD-dependent deacetylase